MSLTATQSDGKTPVATLGLPCTAEETSRAPRSMEESAGLAREMQVTQVTTAPQGTVRGVVAGAAAGATKGAHENSER